MKLSEIRWESVGKLAAGLLLAVAIVVSMPPLLGGDQPEPLPPDVGLPQAVPPAAVPPAPPPKPKPKPKRRPKRATKPKPDHPARPPEHEDDMSPVPPPPIVAALPPAPPPGTSEDFGFERP